MFLDIPQTQKKHPLTKSSRDISSVSRGDKKVTSAIKKLRQRNFWVQGTLFGVKFVFMKRVKWWNINERIMRTVWIATIEIQRKTSFKKMGNQRPSEFIKPDYTNLFIHFSSKHTKSLLDKQKTLSTTTIGWPQDRHFQAGSGPRGPWWWS